MAYVYHIQYSIHSLLMTSQSPERLRAFGQHNTLVQEPKSLHPWAELPQYDQGTYKFLHTLMPSEV